MEKEYIIGLMGAMPEEIQALSEQMSDLKIIRIGNRDYYTGFFKGHKIVMVVSGWGKVAAAATIATLVNVFDIKEVVFTGVAGGIHPDLRIGDVVIASRLIQHDLDARPMIPRYHIPLLGKAYCEVEQERVIAAKLAATAALSEIEVTNSQVLREFKCEPKVLVGDIASGDQFFATEDAKKGLLSDLPDTLCVEMEGAAVAQVCEEYSIPYTVIRTISDESNENSALNFQLFIDKVAIVFSVSILSHLLSSRVRSQA